MLRETLCVAQNTVWRMPDGRYRENIDRLQEVIDQIDEKRPIGADGKHGNLHTDECGCEDV